MSFKCPDCEKKLNTERGLNSHRSQVHDWSPKYKKSICKNCKSDFEYYPKERSGVFCSKNCQLNFGDVDQFKEYRNSKIQKAKKRMKEEICSNCSSVFKYDPNIKKGLFCSKRCFYSSMDEYIQKRPGRNPVSKIKKPCFECGEIVERLPSNVPLSGKVFCSQGCRASWISNSHIFNSQRIYVEETKREVASGWEATIDRMLHDSDLSYGYEYKTFNLPNEQQYTPDFMVENVVIEVKGQPSQRSYKRSKQFMKCFGDEYILIVVGTDMECHIHLKWEDRDELIEVIKKCLMK